MSISHGNYHDADDLDHCIENLLNNGYIVIDTVSTPSLEDGIKAACEMLALAMNAGPGTITVNID